MNSIILRICVIYFLTGFQLAFAGADKLCGYLDAYLKTIGPDKSSTIELHTSWGSNFIGESEEAFAAKRCIRDESPLAKNLCNYLMENSSTEFSGVNFKRFLMCLSPKTKIERDVSFEIAFVSLSWGTDERGSLIELSLKNDKKIGGMVLKLEAEGY